MQKPCVLSSFPHILLPINNQHFPLRQKQIAIIIAEMVSIASLCSVDMREVAEVKGG